MSLKKLDKRDKIIFSEIQTIHIDLLKDIKLNGLNQNKFNQFISNLKKTGPVLIYIFYNIFYHKNLCDRLFNYLENVNILKIYSINKNTLLHKNFLDENIKNINHLLNSSFDYKMLKNELLFEIYNNNDLIIKIKNKDYEEMLFKHRNILKNLLHTVKFNNIHIEMENIINIDNTYKKLKNYSNFTEEINNMLLFNNQIKNLEINDIIYRSDDITVKSLYDYYNINNFKNNINKINNIQVLVFIILLEMIHFGKINIDFQMNNIYINDKLNLCFLDYSNILILDDKKKDVFIKIINILLNNINDNSFFNKIIPLIVINNNQNIIKKIIDEANIELLSINDKKNNICQIHKIINILKLISMKNILYISSDFIDIIHIIYLIVNFNYTHNNLFNKIKHHIKINNLNKLINM